MKGDLHVIDADRHVIEPSHLWDKYLDAAYRGRVVTDGYLRSIDGRAVSTTDPASPVQINPPGAKFWTEDAAYRKTFADPIAAGFDAKSDLKSMDMEGVDVAVHFPTQGLYIIWADWLEPDFAAAICRAYNDWLSDFCATNPTRLKGIALIPWQNPAAAVHELRRVKLELGLSGALVRPNPLRSLKLDHESYLPIYKAASELDIPIVVHEGVATILPQVGRERYSAFDHHIVCHPFEQMLACLTICGNGLLARFPDLRVGFFESGCGWLPFWLDRMDEHWVPEGVGMAGYGSTPLKPSAYFKRQAFISSEAGDEMLPLVVDHVGADYVVLASDYPHPDAVPKFPDGIVGHLIDNDEIAHDAKRKILWDNPARLFSITEKPSIHKA
jgi:predicted TIM-barrel fold metal-dependent hydrolase